MFSQRAIMRPLLFITLVLALIASCWAGEQALRVKRQGWNFPSPTGTEDGGQNNQLPNRRPTTTRRPMTQRTSTPSTTTLAGNDSGPTTPVPSGIIFQVPCDCPSTPEYNPVCGSDGNTYANQGKLDCTRSCGFRVQLTRLGVCQTPRK